MTPVFNPLPQSEPYNRTEVIVIRLSVSERVGAVIVVAEDDVIRGNVCVWGRGVGGQ